MQNNLVTLTVCLPKQLFSKINDSARVADQCINKDIVSRLDQSFSASQTYIINARIKAILYEHIEELEDQIVLLNTELANYRLFGAPRQVPPSCC